MENGTLLAALDLGSNTFRLEIGRLDNGHIHRTEYLKESVRQGNGLDDENNLSVEAMQRGWDCLARFAERLTGFAPQHVHAVATQTLREARNREVFLARAHEILGFPVNVIPGREEARLIYQGVVHMLPPSHERRLVIDIGGRSTELIIGHGYTATVLGSFPLGSVAWSMTYFPQGQLTAEAFKKADVVARAVLEGAVYDYRRENWDVAYGASGTVGAVSDVLTAAGWPEGLITRDGLDWLMNRLLKAQTVDKLRLEGMKDDRKLVIGGGLSVLRAAFDLMNIDQMQAADGALRQGVLYDMIDRNQEQSDVRSSSVRQLAKKFGVDEAQASRVTQAATTFFRQLQATQAPSGAGNTEHNTEHLSEHLNELIWAAQLHELGRHISGSSHHRHGAYILDNADAPGFAMSELHSLSQLVLGQRGKLRKVNIAYDKPICVHQILALRLAIIVCHARREPSVDGMLLRARSDKTNGLVIECPAGWSQKFPQSAYLIREETLAWQKTPWAVTFNEA